MFTSISRELFDICFPVGCVIPVQVPVPPKFEDTKWIMLNSLDVPCIGLCTNTNTVARNEGICHHGGIAGNVTAQTEDKNIIDIGEDAHHHNKDGLYYTNTIHESASSQNKNTIMPHVDKNSYSFSRTGETMHNHAGHIVLKYNNEGKDISHFKTLIPHAYGAYFFKRIF